MPTWKERYDAMKRHYGYRDKDIADITGLSAGSVRQMVTAKKREFPTWLKLAIVNFEKEHRPHVSESSPTGETD